MPVTLSVGPDFVSWGSEDIQSEDEVGSSPVLAWTWEQLDPDSTSIYMDAVYVGFNGVVQEYSGAHVTISGWDYVYAAVTFSMDEDGVPTGVSSVSVSRTSVFSEASKSIKDSEGNQTGVRVPIGLFRDDNGVVVCEKKYFSSAVMLSPSSTSPEWTCDTFAPYAGFDQESVETVQRTGTDTTGKEYKRYLQLRNFEIGDNGDVLNAGDAGWTDPTTGKTSEKLLVRKVIAEGQVRLQYKSHNPMPDGDSTNVAAVWDDTKGGWVKALPVAATNDEQSAEVGAGGRVVVGAKTGETGNLIQLITQPLGDQGGKVPPGYDDGTVIVAQQWDPSSKTIQIKTATALVKTGTTSDWTGSITFAQFND